MSIISNTRAVNRSHHTDSRLIMIFISLLLCTAFSLLLPTIVPAQEPPKAAEEGGFQRVVSNTELTYELDAYYTNVGLHIPLTGKPIPKLEGDDEKEVYTYLLGNIFRPRYMLLEAAVYPMPLLGVYLKNNQQDIYNQGHVAEDVNIISAITAGFPEPYTFSVFFGDVVTFARPEEEKEKKTNKGYMGYLFSYATQHIKDNELIEDKSYEIEWKMKGEMIFKEEHQNWSFRIGVKEHNNPYITDSVYVGLRRSNLDFTKTEFSWIDNSSFDLKWNFSQDRFEPIRQEYIFGKKFPIKGKLYAFKIDIGMIWESTKIYSRPLQDRQTSNYIFILRPNIEF